MGNKRSGKPWTEEEEEYLKENYMDMSLREIMDELERSMRAIYVKSNRLGLKRAGYRWTQERISYLNNNFLDKTDEEIAEELQCSKRTISKKRHEHGLGKRNVQLWHEKEIKYLEENCLNKTDKEIAEDLCRSERSIHHKRNEMGIKKGSRPWSEGEIKHLIFSLDKTDEKAAKKLNRTMKALRWKRRHMGIKKGSRPWSEGEIKHLKKNYSKKTCSVIAKDLNRTRTAIFNKAYRLGLTNKCPLLRYDLWKMRKEICKAYKQGQTLNAITLKYKASPSTICRILDHYGIVFESKRYKYLQSVQCKLNKSMQRGIRKTIKNLPTSHSWTEYVDYSIEDLKEHLESQFKDGMSWDNYGSEWEIDHKRPISSFSFDSPEDEDFHRCWSLCNLQPMWGPENKSKGAKWDGQIKLIY